MIAFSLITLAARGPVFDNKKWLGWGKRNEWAIRKPKPKRVSEDQEMGIKASEEPKPASEPACESVVPYSQASELAQSPSQAQR